jgi:hypothetical protein
MTNPSDDAKQTREARIEHYAGSAANLTRTWLTRGFAAADQVTTWWTTLKTRVKSMKPAAKEAPAA